MRVLFEIIDSHPRMKSLVRSGTVLSKVCGPVTLSLAGSIGPFAIGMLHNKHLKTSIRFTDS